MRKTYKEAWRSRAMRQASLIAAGTLMVCSSLALTVRQTPSVTTDAAASQPQYEVALFKKRHDSHA